MFSLPLRGHLRLLPCILIALHGSRPSMVSCRAQRSFSTVPPSQVRPTLNVVMDIDECMIHCIDADASYRQDEERKEVGSVDGVEQRKVTCEDGMEVHINLRPGLEDFLATLVARGYNVWAFTAGMPVYARPVLKSIDPTGEIFRNAWYRGHCTRINLGGHQVILCLPERYFSKATEHHHSYYFTFSTHSPSSLG